MKKPINRASIMAALMASFGVSPRESIQIHRPDNGFQHDRVLAINSGTLGLFGGYVPGSALNPLGGMAVNAGGFNPGTGIAFNDGLFEGANPSEFLSNYAVRYQDPLLASLEMLGDLLAPPVPTNGSQIAQYAVYNFADAFLAMDNSQDIVRGIGQDFPTLQNPTKTMASQRIPNVGLGIEVDEDEEKLDPDWQQRKVALLKGIIVRTLFRQKLALAVAGATVVNKTWTYTNTPVDPDLDILDEILVAPLKPTGMIYGPTAWSKRLHGYSSQLTAGAIAGQQRKIADLPGWFGVGDVELVLNRVATGGITTSAMVGQYVLSFISGQNLGRDDFSNLKSFRAPTKTGAPFATYVRQVGDKRWRIWVETYELPALTSVVGLTVTNVA